MCAFYTIFLIVTMRSAWKRFDKLYEAYATKLLNDTGEAFTDLYDVENYGKVDGVKLPVDFIVENFEELKVWKCMHYGSISDKLS